MSSLVILLLLATVAVVVIGVAMASAMIANSRQAQRDLKPAQDLARAARLLDQVRASDEAVPQLPASLRTEVDRFLSTYYKELQ